jgi:3-oxoacyl-[acyl-carrier protein] reductase
VAAALASGGARVGVVDIDAAAADRVADELTARGAGAVAIPADTSDASDVQRAVDTVVASFGAVDIAVNCAGIIRDAVPVEDTAPEQWEQVMAVNARSPFLVARAVASHMKRRQHGRIVNIASRRWLGGGGLASYAASKGAVISLTRSLAIELGPHGITANAVSPSLVVTPLFLAMPDEEREEVLARVRRQPIPRPATVEDVAHVVSFFAADEAGYITGQNVYVGGGQELGSSGLT